jgi:hypothetical protein
MKVAAPLLRQRPLFDEQPSIARGTHQLFDGAFLVRRPRAAAVAFLMYSGTILSRLPRGYVDGPGLQSS